MANTDRPAKAFFGKRDIAADLIGYELFRNTIHVDPGSLTILNPVLTQIADPYHTEEGSSGDSDDFEESIMDVALEMRLSEEMKHLLGDGNKLKDLTAALLRVCAEESPDGSDPLLLSLTPGDFVLLADTLSPLMARSFPDKFAEALSADSVSEKLTAEEILNRLTDAACSVARDSLRPALEEVVRQFNISLDRVRIAIFDLEPMGDKRLDTIFTVTRRVVMMYREQIRQLREEEYLVRKMAYDQMVEKARKEHKVVLDKAPKMGKGMRKSDVIVPVIPIVIYLKPGDNWDAPRDVYEAIKVWHPPLLRYSSNFFYNVVCPGSMEESDFDAFRTELGLVFRTLKNSKKKFQSRFEEMNATYSAQYDAMSDEGRILLNHAMGMGVPDGTGKKKGRPKTVCEVYRAVAEETRKKTAEKIRAEEQAKKGQELAENVKGLMENLEVDQETAMKMMKITPEQRACCEPFL